MRDDDPSGARVEPLVETAYRAREGPDYFRPSSPPWDTTSLRVRRQDKERFDGLRLRLSERRVLPHWEAFERVLDLAEAALVRERGRA